MKLQKFTKITPPTAMLTLLLLIMSLNTTAGESTQDSPSNGMISVQSTLSFSETTAKLEKILEEKGMTLFTVIDHAKGAASVEMDLNPTTLFIFGNPKAGSPLMQCSTSVALDLPQKMLITESEEGIVSITYNDPQYLANRHTLTGCEKNIEKISAALKAIAKTASTH